MRTPTRPFPLVRLGLSVLLLAGSCSTSLANFPPIVSVSANPLEAMVEQPVQFDSSGTLDPDGDPLTYLWTFGDGQTSTEANPQHAFAQAGFYRVNLQVHDGTTSRFSGASVTVLAPTSAVRPAQSAPLAELASASELWVVNPDADTVSVLSIGGGTAVKTNEIAVGKKPRTIAFSGDGAHAFVVCQGANRLDILDTATKSVAGTVATGHLPYGVAVSPSDDQVVVTNQGDGSISIFPSDFTEPTIVTLGGQPRAVAVPGSGTHAYVTDYLTTGSTATVWEIDLAVRQVSRTISMQEDPGPNTTASSRGFPNLLSAIGIEPSGLSLWIGGLKSNTGTGTFVSGQELTSTTRNRGVMMEVDVATGAELLDHRIDPNNADSISGMAFSPNGRYAYVTHQGAETVSVYDLPLARTVDTSDGTSVEEISRVDVGFAPQGIVVSDGGTRAYVTNFLSRSVSILDISDPSGLSVIQTVPVVEEEPLPASILNGKRLFYRSREPLHSKSNYIACASCHADGGMADGRTWDFTQAGEGLRNTIDLRGKGGMDHGPVHWSANFNEIQDFEIDIVNGFEGSGLAQDGMPPHPSLGPAGNGGRSQDLDDLAAYVSSLAEVPRSPLRKNDGTLNALALQGRQIFFEATVGCAQCHQPPTYTDSVLTPDPADFILHDVGTLLPSSGHRLGGTLPGLDTPSLLGAWATPPYLHDGRAATLRDVLTTHNAGELHGKTSHLSSSEIDALVEFLKSIDGSPNDQHPEVSAGDPVTTKVGWMVQLNGSISDDGLPAIPGRVLSQWESTSPDFSILDATAVATSIVFHSPGTYTLTLKASDNDGATFAGSDTVALTVNPADSPAAVSYADYRATWFTGAELTDDQVSGMLADPDGDRLANMVEYYFGSDPTSYSRSTFTLGVDAIGPWVRHERAPRPEDVSVQWQYSNDLVNWSAVDPAVEGLVDDQSGNHTIETRFPGIPGPRRFFRLLVTH